MALTLSYWQIFFDEYFKFESQVTLGEKLKHRRLCRFSRDYIDRDALLGFLVSCNQCSKLFRTSFEDTNFNDYRKMISDHDRDSYFVLDKLFYENKFESWAFIAIIPQMFDKYNLRDACAFLKKLYEIIHVSFGYCANYVFIPPFSLDLYIYSARDSPPFDFNENDSHDNDEPKVEFKIPKFQCSWQKELHQTAKLEAIFPIQTWLPVIKNWPNISLKDVIQDEEQTKPLTTAQRLQKKKPEFGICFAPLPGQI